MCSSLLREYYGIFYVSGIVTGLVAEFRPRLSFPCPCMNGKYTLLTINPDGSCDGLGHVFGKHNGIMSQRARDEIGTLDKRWKLAQCKRTYLPLGYGQI